MLARTSASSQGRSSTFADNLTLPVHRWFRYSAGFSADWVYGELGDAAKRGPVRVLDPFAGAGTVLLEAERSGVLGIGVEAHSFVHRVARAKLSWRVDAGELLEAASDLADRATTFEPSVDKYPSLIQRCFPIHTLRELDRLKRSWNESANNDSVSELLWLALTAILRPCSPVGTAQWQYILPNKIKASTVSPAQAFRAQVDLMASDIRLCHLDQSEPTSAIYSDDARSCASVPDGWATLVLTSPPYMNNFDYADATRLEMTFWGEVSSWGDLHPHIRQNLMRSCTQHVDADRATLGELLEDTLLDPIRDELQPICLELSRVRLTKGGKKSYHSMVAAYFADLARVWKTLRSKTAPHARLCFVIGDSAPYGIYIPVEEWLGRLALAAGFKSYTFFKLRDRNTKWKNRKHRVPLKEGQLWVEA